MTTITTELLDAIRPAINEALAPVAKKYGLRSLTAEGMTYNSAAGNFTVKVAGVADGGMDADAHRYAQNASLMGLPPMGAEFRDPLRGTQYKTVGLRKGGRVVVENQENGKKYLMGSDEVKRACALDKRFTKKEAA